METLRVSEPDGDTDTFDAFYAANFDRLMLQLYAYTADVSAAQDAVQEAFSRAWPRWDRLVRYDEPAAWVRRVALTGGGTNLYVVVRQGPLLTQIWQKHEIDAGALRELGRAAAQRLCAGAAAC